MSVRFATIAVSLAVMMSACQPAGTDAPAAGASAIGAEGASAASPAPASAAPSLATSTGGPKRADGFWESSWGGLKQQYCVGGDSEEKYSIVDELSVMGDCSKKDFQRTPAGWQFETVCAMMGVTTTQKGTITGDFRSSYKIDQEVISSETGTMRGTIEARRLGDCPAPYKPGDLVTSGMTVNMAN